MNRPKLSRSGDLVIPMNELMSREDWLKGRRARREISNKVAPEIIRRPSSSSDHRLRKLCNGERGLPFKRTEELQSLAAWPTSSATPASYARAWGWMLTRPSGWRQKHLRRFASPSLSTLGCTSLPQSVCSVQDRHNQRCRKAAAIWGAVENIHRGDS